MDKKEEVDPFLGKLAKDKVTGFTGIVTVKGIHLYGCNTYCLTPLVKDGKLEDAHSFDEGRIELIGEGISPEKVRSGKPGGENVNLEERAN